MTQKRIQDFGSTVTSVKINDINKIKTQSGLLTEGPVIEVVRTDAIKLNPATISTQQGILITEDTTKELDIPITVDAVDYTVVLRHIVVATSGGSAAFFELVTNFFPLRFFSDATIVGWVKYPGGSVALDNTMLFQPRHSRVIEPSNDNVVLNQATAPFSNKWFLVPPTLPNLVVTEAFDGQRVFTTISNTDTIIISSATYLLPFVAGEFPPSIIRTTAKADFQAAIIMSVLDENGTEYFPSNNNILNTDWSIFDMKLPNFNSLGNFAPHSTWVLKLEMQLNPGKTLSIQSISVSDFNLPVLGIVDFTADFVFPYPFVRLPSAIGFFAPLGGLPVGPTLGDRYVASGTANGWTDNSIFEWDGAAWIETVPNPGHVILFENELVTGVDRVWNGVRWDNGVPSHKILV